MSDKGRAADKIAWHNATLSAKTSGLTDVFKDIITKAMEGQMG